MEEYRKAFKEKCTECIWKMINDESVKHITFYKQTYSVEQLWSIYIKRLKASNSLLNHTDLYKEFLDRLEKVYREATES
jgi:hypothetical protein